MGICFHGNAVKFVFVFVLFLFFALNLMFTKITARRTIRLKGHLSHLSLTVKRSFKDLVLNSVNFCTCSDDCQGTHMIKKRADLN